MDDFQKLAKLIEIELMVRFQAHAVQKFVQVDVFGVDLKTEFRHHHS